MRFRFACCSCLNCNIQKILESLIKFRWKILPRDQCQAIKTYIIGLVLKLSQTDEQLQREKVVIGKINDVLVQVPFFFPFSLKLWC